MPETPTVGQVMLDYSVRAESAAGNLRNALMLLDVGEDFEYGDDYRAVVRLVRDALAKLESRGVS